MNNETEVLEMGAGIKKEPVVPIAKYDRETGTAYLEYADGRREIIE